MMNANDGLVRLILDNVPHLVFVKDDRSIFLYANRALLEIFAPERRDRVIGHTTVEEFTPEEADTFLEEDRRALSCGESEIVEEIIAYDGQRRVYNTRKIAFDAPDGRRCLLGISTDITELTQREEQLLEANRHLQEFSASAAHDFRAPLASYVTSLEGIQADPDTALGERSRQKIDFIIDSAIGLSQGLNSLLRTSKAARLGLPIEHSPCDLNVVLSKLRFNLSHSLQTTRFRIYSNRLPLLSVDEELVRQLFQNLVENSIKYRDTRRLSRIKFLYQRRPDSHRIVVEDNGIGISPTNAAKVFEMFEQGDRKGFGGVGMGLALCKRIVSLHRGTITVDDEFSTGCRFIIDLPLGADCSFPQGKQSPGCMNAPTDRNLAMVG